MQKYEYRIVTSNGEKFWDAGKKAEKEMNDMALDGWKVISVDYFCENEEPWHYANITFEREI